MAPSNQRRSFSGSAGDVRLQGGISATDVSFTASNLSASERYPSGVGGPFFMVLDPEQSTEEKVLIATRSGVTFTFADGGRGQDGTSAMPHAADAKGQHVFTAQEADEANNVVSQVLGQVTGKGQLLVGLAARKLGVLLPGVRAGMSLLSDPDSPTGWAVGIPPVPVHGHGATPGGGGELQFLGAGAVNGERTVPARADHKHEAPAPLDAVPANDARPGKYLGEPIQVKTPGVSQTSVPYIWDGYGWAQLGRIRPVGALPPAGLYLFELVFLTTTRRLAYWSGSSWVDPYPEPLEKFQSELLLPVTTNNDGAFTITFPTPFANQLRGISIQSATSNIGGVLFELLGNLSTDRTRASFIARGTENNSAHLPNYKLTVSYIATGY